MKRLYLCFFVVVFLACCSSIPKWYINPRVHYNPSEYIVGVGEGATPADATAIAQSELVSQISVQVRSETEVAFISRETDNSAYFVETINRHINTVSDELVIGMEVLQQDHHRGIYYVMVGLKKSRLLGNMSIEMSALSQSIRGYQERAERHLSAGELIPAIENFGEAQRLLIELGAKKRIYDGLSGVAFPTHGVASINEILGKVRDIINDTTFDIVSGDDQLGIRGRVLPKAIVFSALLRSSTGERQPLVDLPIRLSYGDGSVIETGFTNSRGEYMCYVLAKASTTDRGRVVIAIDTEKMPTEYRLMGQNKRSEVSYTIIEPPLLPVTVTVFDTDGSRNQVAHGHISKHFQTNRLIDTAGAPTFIYGRVTASPGTSGNMRYTATANLDIEMGISATGQVVGSMRATGQGNSNQSQMVAIATAVQNISVDAREFHVMVSRAKSSIETAQRAESNQRLQRGRMLYQAGDIDAAIETLLQVEYGDDTIAEALRLLNEMKR